MDLWRLNLGFSGGVLKASEACLEQPYTRMYHQIQGMQNKTSLPVVFSNSLTVSISIRASSARMQALAKVIRQYFLEKRTTSNPRFVLATLLSTLAPSSHRHPSSLTSSQAIAHIDL